MLLNGDLALEELKLLQEVIGRHENHAMRVKGLLFVIIAGLTAATYAEGMRGSRGWMFAGAIVLTLLFMVWELYHRAISQQAITRAGAVESQLRGEADYDGPKIGHSLSNKIELQHLIAEARRPWNWSSLVVVLSSLAFLFWFAPPPKETSAQKPSNATAARQAPVGVLGCPTFQEIKGFFPGRRILSD